MSSIEIKKIGITKLDTDAVVNAANTGLWEGGGVCGYISHDAGFKEMTAACQKIGHCDEGSAVITPGFKLFVAYKREWSAFHRVSVNICRNIRISGG